MKAVRPTMFRTPDEARRANLRRRMEDRSLLAVVGERAFEVGDVGVLIEDELEETLRTTPAGLYAQFEEPVEKLPPPDAGAPLDANGNIDIGDIEVDFEIGF